MKLRKPNLKNSFTTKKAGAFKSPQVYYLCIVIVLFILNQIFIVTNLIY